MTQAARNPLFADLRARLSEPPRPLARMTLDAFAERYADDFLGFCALLEIVPKSGKRQRFVLNASQRAYCDKRTPRDVVLKGRQVGLTTLEQARDVWHFLTRRGARVVATCQSITDHGPLKLLAANYRVFFDSLIKAGLALSFDTEATGEWVIRSRDASLRIVEAGASEAAAAKKGRAGTITRLHLTETAFYEYAEETLNALLECVPGVEHGSEIVSESTPNGAAGVFFEQCQAAKEGRSGYAFHFLPWYMHEEYRVPLAPGEMIAPETDREQYLAAQGVPPDAVKWYRRKVAEKGQDLTDQEYPSDPATCFLVSGRLFFDRARTTALLAAAREPVEMGPMLRLWRKPDDKAYAGARYLLVADPSEGTGGDPGAALLYDRATGEHVGTLHGQFTPWEMARRLAALGRRFGNALIAVERNNHGHAVLQALEKAEHYPNIYRAADGKLGWLTNAVSRTAALDALEDAHRSGEWRTPDRAVCEELLTFVVNGDKAEAARGAHDDLVLAAAIGWDVLRRPIAVQRRSADLPPA